MKIIKIVVALTAGLSLQSCAREDTLRTEGLTLGAGNALATNSALQVIDPWPNGVEDTDLSIPNTHPNDKADDAGSSGTTIKPVGSTNP